MRCARITLDCGSLVVPTAATIDQIARLQLAMQRRGCELELNNANPCLLELIGLVGLAGVLRVESRRQAEQRKQPLRIEKEGELGDLSTRQLEHLQGPGLITALRTWLVLPEGR